MSIREQKDRHEQWVEALKSSSPDAIRPLLDTCEDASELEQPIAFVRREAERSEDERFNKDRKTPSERREQELLLTRRRYELEIRYRSRESGKASWGLRFGLLGVFLAVVAIVIAVADEPATGIIRRAIAWCCQR